MPRAPIAAEAIFEVVRDRVGEILEIDEATLTWASTYVGDLDADSFAMIELVESLEEEFGDRTVGGVFDDDDLADLHTLGDTVEYIVMRLDRFGRASSGPIPGDGS